MHDKVIEIIVYILNEIGDSKQINEIDLNKLSIDGYSETEIITAFAWILSKADTGEKLFNEPSFTSGSHRFFHNSEKNVFTTGGMGYLIQMKELGIISDTEEEQIINKILLAGYQKAGPEEVKLILSTLLFETEDNRGSLNRLILNNNDTVH